MPAGAELSFDGFATLGARPPAAGVSAAGKKTFHQFLCLLVLKVLCNPQLRPAFRGRQLSGAAQQKLVLGDALDVVVFQQFAEMIRGDDLSGKNYPSCKPSSWPT